MRIKINPSYLAGFSLWYLAGNPNVNKLSSRKRLLDQEIRLLFPPFPPRRSLLSHRQSLTHARPPPAPAHRGMRSRRTGPPAPSPAGTRRWRWRAGRWLAGREGRRRGVRLSASTDTRSRTRGREPAVAAPGWLWAAVAAAEAARVALSRLYVPVIVCLGHLRRGSPPPYTW